MKKLLILLFVLATIVACQKEESSNVTPLDENSVKSGNNMTLEDEAYFCLSEGYIDVERPLVAGQHTTVGYVKITTDNDNLYVQYFLDEDPVMHFMETHVYAGSYAECPTNKKNNPKIGHFPQGGDGDDAPFIYTFPLSEMTYDENGNFIVAVHSVVEFACGSIELVEANLPSEPRWLKPNFTTYATPKLAYFWKAELAEEGATECWDGIDDPEDMWDGAYPGWCLDPLALINPNKCYEADLYSSYGSIPEGLLLNPQNLDKINWLYNQHFIGKVYPPGNNEENVFTYGDIQILVWLNLNNTTNLAPSVLGLLGGVGDWNGLRVGYLQDLMDANGEGFRPNCEYDEIGIILVPYPLEAGGPAPQPILIFKPFDCNWCDDETAWMTGSEWFVNKGGSWASYQQFIEDCD